ncbi:MAG: class I SAM-dependent methyltransferase [Chloroflexi bacterium]|nr:class I SAM-dependent methyltransferase [Chloroflexota bacterium]
MTEFDNISPRPDQPRTKIGKAWWSLVRFGFRLLYNEMAWTYDLVSRVVSMGQWRNWQRVALKHLNAEPGALILEAAHGTGNFQFDLAAAGYRRIAFDFSAQMGRIARRKLQKNNLPAPLVRAMGQHLPFPDATFDAIVSTFPTPFIVEKETLRETYRVLKPGARLVIVPNAVLTSGGAAKDVLETAYRVTGQRGAWGVDIENRFAQAGFNVRLVMEPCKRSIAQVLIAEKS